MLDTQKLTTSTRFSTIKEAPKETVNHPSHYNQGGIEVIDIIESATKGLNDSEGFYIGNILKYLCRWKFKNGLEDLKKAKWYLDKFIENMENGK